MFKNIVNSGEKERNSYWCHCYHCYYQTISLGQLHKSRVELAIRRLKKTTLNIQSRHSLTARKRNIYSQSLRDIAARLQSAGTERSVRSDTSCCACCTGAVWAGMLLVIPLVVIHYNDVIMSAMASQITSLTIVYSTVYRRRRSKKHQSSASLAFVRGIHRWPVNSPHKGPVTRKMFPFDDVIMYISISITFVVQVTKYFDIFRMCVSLRSVSSNTINSHTQHINVKQYLFLIYICYILLLLLIKLCVSWWNEADTAEFQWPNLTTQIDILCVSILFRHLLQWLHMWSVGILEADFLRHTKHKIAFV